MKLTTLPSYYSDRLTFESFDTGWRDEYTLVHIKVDGRIVAYVQSERYQELTPYDAYVRHLRAIDKQTN